MQYGFKFLAIILLLVISVSASADDDQHEARRLAESGKILPLEVILDTARKIQPGKVLEVEFKTKKGKTIYEIEILNTKGIVLELKLDAATGNLISNEKEE